MTPGGVTPAVPLDAHAASLASMRGGLADDIDPKTGEIRSLRGADPVDAAVLFQLTVERGSGGAVLDDGQAFDAVKKNNLDAPQRLRFEAERVMRRFVERGDLSVTAIDIVAGEAAGDLGALSITYNNLRRGNAPATVRAA